uniref:Uncharacterized protein n=1 Tax=Fagus sylvatica TaxID=28930 RepID=A0A2N9F0R7_FAGSY
MERIQRQRSNPSSSTQSRSNKFRSNPTTKDDKIPNTNNPDDSTDSAKSRRGHVDDCSNLPALLGTCPFMCPVAERSQRERLRDLAVFERLHGNPRKTSADLAVKKPMNSSSIGASSPHKNKVEVEVVGSNLPESASVKAFVEVDSVLSVEHLLSSFAGLLHHCCSFALCNPNQCLKAAAAT